MVNPEMRAIKLEEREEKAFNEVVAKLDKDTEYMPVLYAGWQLVSGLNYIFICKTRSRGSKDWTSVVQMQIYAPLSDMAELSELKNIIV